MFGVTLLITLYFQLAHVMSALDLETEEAFVWWTLPAYRRRALADAYAAARR